MRPLECRPQRAGLDRLRRVDQAQELDLLAVPLQLQRHLI